MNDTDARTLQKWLEDNDAKMFAYVQHGYYVVHIHRPNTPFSAVTESFESLDEAVRHAQLSFDIQIIRAIKRAAKIVGQA